ncbi:biotin--[acetyl-CoA-carboxylase] ligase [Candidatus Ichthyocystis hellenicum]|uniref:biotin--[acetyl-CoA-carboxylase] ligase n=1 Tax=Candidatus Ichthyocystis hellenicum TaxID=1561003 RepID=UPI000B2EF4B0|nr:biotin--[acetyl-CoA-carboxylase] ligase [Candidatus Ichthyocystis hellenicum]
MIYRDLSSVPDWSWLLWDAVNSVSSVDLSSFSCAARCSLSELRDTILSWCEIGVPLRFIAEHRVTLDKFGHFWVDTSRLANIVSSPVISCVTCSSTQDMAFSHKQKEPFVVFWAEYQSNGRGRNSRSWVSPISQGLTFSVGWHTPYSGESHDGLSLMISLVVLEVLHAFGHTQVVLKWPNDLLLSLTLQKVSGILVEQTRNRIVAGIGINLPVLLSIDSGNQKLQLQQHRERMAVAIINKLRAYLSLFRKYGFQYFKSSWIRHHIFKNSYLLIRTSREDCYGWCAGIHSSGALLLRGTGNVVNKFFSGDVSLCRRSSDNGLLSC